MSTQTRRRPRGMTAGGQFAPHRAGEPDLATLPAVATRAESIRKVKVGQRVWAAMNSGSEALFEGTCAGSGGRPGSVFVQGDDGSFVEARMDRGTLTVHATGEALARRARFIAAAADGLLFRRPTSRVSGSWYGVHVARCHAVTNPDDAKEGVESGRWALSLADAVAIAVVDSHSGACSCLSGLVYDHAL